MRRTLIVAATAALAVTAFPAPAVAQDGSGQVTIVQAATYDAEATIDVYLCVDDQTEGELFETGDIVGPEAWDAGTYDLTVGWQPECEDHTASAQLDLADSDDVTILIHEAEEETGLSILENDTSCVEDGGRLIVRSGTYSWLGDPVGLTYEQDGETVPLVEDVPPGGQESIELPAGTYEGVNVTGFDGDGEISEEFEIVEGQATVLYIIGGLDIAVGLLSDSLPLQDCPEPIEPIEDPEVPLEDLETPVEDLEVPAVTARPAFTG